MKYLLMLLLLASLVASCGGDAPAEETEASPELIEEIKTVEAENEELEETIEEIETTTDELEEMLEEL